MLSSIYSTSVQWESTTIPPLRLRLRHLIFVELRWIITRTLSGKPLSKLRMTMSIELWVWESTIIVFRPPFLPRPFLKFLLFDLLSMNHEMRNVHVIDEHVSTSFFNNHFRNTQKELTHLFPKIDNHNGRISRNFLNFRAYSFTLIFSWRTLINSIPFSSLFSRGKNLSIKQFWSFPNQEYPHLPFSLLLIG